MSDGRQQPVDGRRNGRDHAAHNAQHRGDRRLHNGNDASPHGRDRRGHRSPGSVPLAPQHGGQKVGHTAQHRQRNRDAVRNDARRTGHRRAQRRKHLHGHGGQRRDEPLHKRGQHGVPQRQQQRCHRAEAHRQLVPERLQVRGPERTQQVKQLHQHRLQHLAPQRRNDADDVLPPLRKAVQNRLTVGGPRLLHARPKPLPDRVQQRQRGLDHRRERRAELLPYAGCRRGKPLPNRLPRRGERRKKFLQVRPEIRPRTAQALQHALPDCRQAAQVAARCTAAACRGAGGGSCGLLGLRRGLGGLLLLFRRRRFVLRRGGQAVDLVKFCQTAGRFHALCRRSPQRHAQLVHNAARLLPGVAHAPQRRRNFIQRRAQGRRGLLQR